MVGRDETDRNKMHGLSRHVSSMFISSWMPSLEQIPLAPLTLLVSHPGSSTMSGDI